MKQLVIASLVSLLVASPSYGVEQASEQRLDEVAAKGSHVMPFDLELTLHVFSKVAKGGLQQVVAKDPNNSQQITLIREHLTQISDQFNKGNFADPARIHGDSMPGLQTLRQAKPEDIAIVYTALADGAQVEYLSDSPIFIDAIHQWFDAQLSDHARHAMPGHSHDHMHNH